MPAKPHPDLLATLAARFERHGHRHPGLAWAAVETRLGRTPRALAALQAMEESGGEPDVVGAAGPGGEIAFWDCAAESPVGRRSLCYDRAALDSRKANKPAGNAVDTARAWGAELLDESQYAHLQTLGEFDTKTSSWLLTPLELRALGGALFGDRRFGRVFTYHNGAESYYAARGFRAVLRV